MTSPPVPFAVQGPAEIIAHRGYSARAPENTVVALLRGLDAGADSVEFDLQITADGVPVLLHDETLDRTTDGNGPVANHTVGDLVHLDAGSWFDPAFAGEPVPTLASALEAVGARCHRIYAEIKGVTRIEDVDRIVAEVREAGFSERTIYISMEWETLERARAVDASSLVGYIVERARRADEAMARAQGDPGALLDFDRRILLRRPALADAARARGIALATWTVDSPEDATRLLDMGVPRITTNHVSELLAWRDGLSGRAQEASRGGPDQ